MTKNITHNVEYLITELKNWEWVIDNSPHHHRMLDMVTKNNFEEKF